jgi:hypothetical protein
MGLVMFRVEDFAFKSMQFLPDLFTHPELLFQPERHRFPEGPDSGRGIGQICLQKSFEFYPGLIIEGDIVKPIGRNCSLLQAIGYGIGGKTMVMLLAAETFLLGGGNNFAAAHKAGRAVMIKG